VVYGKEFEALEDALESHMTWEETKEMIIESMIRNGEAFVEIVENVGGRFYGLKVLPWQTMRVVSDSHGKVLAFAQTQSNNKVEAFKPEEIIHIKWKPSLDNPVVGRSPIDTLFFDVRIDVGAQISNHAIFENHGVPSNVFILSEDLNAKSADRMMDEIKTHFAKPENAHKSAVLQGVQDIKQLSQNVKDMEYVMARRFTTEKVCSLLGVPRVLLGYTDNVNYSNHEGQMAKYLEMTINPLQKKISSAIWQKISKYFSQDLYFEFVRHEADRDEELHSRARLDFSGGIVTLNEARQMIGMEPIDGINTDEPIYNGVPVSELGMGLDSLTSDNDGAPS
jgi:HK97 family phage portal protein